MLQIIFLGCI